MRSDLFSLISLAGSASLDELRARSSIDPRELARELATMLRDGTVALSPTPGVPGGPNLQGLISSLEKSTLETQEDGFVEALRAALADDNDAAAITVSPTSRGFKRSL
jgi:hypothetical protein